MVFVFFASVGAAVLVHLGSRPTTAVRAVSGNPGNAAMGDPSAVPANHPPLELPAEVIAFLDELTEKAENAPDDAKAWLQLGRARYRAGRFDRRHYADARRALEHVLELDADNSEAIRLSGNLEYENSRFADAEALFRRYLELNADDEAVLTDLGSALLFQDKFDEAKAVYNRVIELDPEFMQAWYNLALILHSEGDTKGALRNLQRARELTDDPSQRDKIDGMIAAAEGRPASRPSGQRPNSQGKVPSTNSGSPFQRSVEALLLDHPIVGPKIAAVEWSGPANARVYFQGFPMDKMPAVVRNKFKAKINEGIAALSRTHDLDAAVNLELVDRPGGAVMDRLDGKEFVGAFDEPEVQ
ncbi:MAG: tetratricopeptide repeat protein [Candidatus Binatia bacterium]